jgi:hypothetical protein
MNEGVDGDSEGGGVGKAIGVAIPCDLEKAFTLQSGVHPGE